METNLNSNEFEQKIIGKTGEEAERLLGLPVESKCNEEYVFIVGTTFFGLFKKRLYLYLKHGVVYDYFY